MIPASNAFKSYSLHQTYSCFILSPKQSLCLIVACTSNCGVVFNCLTIWSQTHVQIKYLEATEMGLKFVNSTSEQALNVYPEADMLLAVKTRKPFSSFSDWGKGWADPEIRRKRLEMIRHGKQRMAPSPRKSRKRKATFKAKPDPRTSRGRLAAKLFKTKWYIMIQNFPYPLAFTTGFNFSIVISILLRESKFVQMFLYRHSQWFYWQPQLSNLGDLLYNIG